ncbi:MAG TPA: DM13 domain-containing protein [Terriglobales bacterium]|nr:DM13 domain-containing protein [Terriglobales bacterium]
MQARKLVTAVVAAAVVFGLWYAFRPERLFTNVTVNEQFPEAQAAAASTQLRMGQFHDGAHQTRGMATIHQLADGKRVLRLTNFATSNGPDVHVYLAVASEALDNESVTRDGFVDLGTIKGNMGDQNYDLPAELELQKYNSVVIWCKRFSVNFGAAPLGTGGMMPATPQKLVAAGEFHKVAHDAQGYAMVHQLADGRRILRFTEFETSNGPELHVYAVAAADATDSDSVKKAGFVDLGALKGNKGDQNYELPKDLDLSKYQSVAVWCKRFSVNFATAPLTPKS